MKRAAFAIAGTLFAAFFAAVLWAGSPAVSASAAGYGGMYSFVIPSYDVEMEVRETREIAVVENIEVEFRWEGQSGIIRDLPRDKGVRYTDFSVQRNGRNIPYSLEEDDPSLLSVYLGTSGNYVSTETPYRYTISYTMTVPKLEEEGYLPLDVLGKDWQAPISEFTATVRVPAGLDDYRVYADSANVQVSREGNTLSLRREGIYLASGITLDLSFGAGVLKSPPPDLTPLYAAGIAAAVALVLLLMKAFLRNPLLVRTVNLSAPGNMDPLRMGKLIDTIIDKEDVSSLVFYLAAEGYLNIDLTDEDDPILSITGKTLPASAPEHVRIFFDGLFDRREEVRVSELRYAFYATADRTVKRLKATSEKTYKPAGTACIVLLGVLAAILFGVFGIFYSLRTVSPYFLDVSALFVAGCAYAISAGICYFARLRSFKWKRKTVLFTRIGGFFLGCLPALFGFLFLRPAYGMWFFVVVAVASSFLGALSSCLLVRTKGYNAALEQILGFKDFILYTEKDRISFMLKEDPELFYRILPYAQVLGVTDAWTEKFAGLTLEPPAWMTCDSLDILCDALIFRSLFTTAMLGMGRSFAARPTNHGGGFSGGGFGGGFSGGGFGGGGGRSF